MRCLISCVAALVGLASLAGLAPIVAQGTKPNWPVELVAQTGHTRNVVSMAFSPDGRTIVSGGDDNALIVWNMASGRPLRVIKAHNGWVTAVAFSPDGRTIASGSDDKTLKLWEPESGRLLRTLTALDGRVLALAFSPDGRTIGSGDEKALTLWDVGSGRLLHKIARDEGVTGVAFSPDGRTIAYGAHGGSGVILWDVARARELRTLPGPGDFEYVSTIAFSPDGRTIVFGSSDKSLKVWDVASGRLLHTLTNHEEVITNVAFLPDGRTIVSGSWDNTIRLWDATRGRLLRTIAVDDLFAFALSPDGRTIAACQGTKKKVSLWDTASGQRIREFRSGSNFVHAVAVSPDGRSIASGGLDQTLRLWEMAGGRELRTLGQHREGFISAAAFSPDGRTIISASWDTLKVSDVTNGRELRSLPLRPKQEQPIAFSPDGSAIISQIEKTYLVLRETASGRELRTLDLYGEAFSIAFSPDGRMIVAATSSGVQVWDGTSVREPKSLPHNGMIYAVAFAPDGRTIVSGGNDKKLKLWETASRREFRTLAGHDDAIQSVAFSPDGRTIVSASWDGTLKLWDVASGRELRTLRGHTGAVHAVAVSPDGRTIVSGGADTTVRRWSVSGELLTTSFVSDDEWLTITPEGFFDASEKGADILSIVRGLDVWSIEQFYQSLYRPDLVREKLAGDRRGLVRAAAARLDLAKILASGNPPTVTLISPRDGAREIGEQVMAEVEIRARDGGIGRIEWRINGVAVGLERAPASARAGQPIRLSRALLLEDGDNEIEVVAYNSADLVASPPARARMTIQAPATRAPTRLFVLAIGLNDYADPKFKLTYAVPDAGALAEALREAGKGLYAEVIVTAIHDADVKRGKLDAVFNELAAKVRPTDVFVFFVAGHGKTVDGRYYFIPHDFKRAGELVSEGEIVAQGIAQEHWQTWFARIQAGKSLLLFDTCESGTLTGEGRETELLARRAASDRLVQATGRTILTASSGDADAIEGYRGHGLFTYNLLDALQRADSDGNGTIDVAELAIYVYANVTALSEQVFRERQVPQVRITANYALTKPVRVLPESVPGIIISEKSTHQVANATELLMLPAVGARRVRKLDAKMPVTLVRSESGWALVAREGRPLGFVATKDLAPIP